MKLSNSLSAYQNHKPPMFTRVPMREITNPMKAGPLMTYKDYWWAVDKEENVFFFRGKSYSPQCNKNRVFVETRLAPGIDTSVVLIPWAWVVFKVSDYA